MDAAEIANKAAMASPTRGVGFSASPIKSKQKFGADQQSNINDDDDNKSYMTGMMSKTNTNMGLGSIDQLMGQAGAGLSAFIDPSKLTGGAKSGLNNNNL
jgi:uncharacterized protein YidB (DUF937 family)